MPSPPYFMFISSTYFIRSIACCFPMYSKRVPPKSFVILYLPSEKAPAPPKPLIIEQLLHEIQLFTFFPSIGHFLFASSCPASKTAILQSGFLSISSYAPKIPPGPAPIIITSYLSIYYILPPIIMVLYYMLQAQLCTYVRHYTLLHVPL